MNGWTALHWACKRNHLPVVHILLNGGANANLANDKGQLPANLATEPEILTLFNISSALKNTTEMSDNENTVGRRDTTFVPNYLRHPVFPYTKKPSLEEDALQDATPTSTFVNPVGSMQHLSSNADPQTSGLLLKVRIADAEETDFFEVELCSDKMSFNGLREVLCQELEIRDEKVGKVRKLPNVIVRKDEDVKRLRHNTELEVVLKN